MNTIIAGDEGTVITVDTGASLAGTSVHVIDVTKPDGETVSWPAQVVDDQFLEYTAEAGDLSQAGNYIVRARIESTAGKWRGRETIFEVQS